MENGERRQGKTHLAALPPGFSTLWSFWAPLLSFYPFSFCSHASWEGAQFGGRIVILGRFLYSRRPFRTASCFSYSLLPLLHYIVNDSLLSQLYIFSPCLLRTGSVPKRGFCHALQDYGSCLHLIQVVGMVVLV